MQTLKITGFLGIEDAHIELDSITVIIGPQASGKSVVARLFFFFNEYFADFDELPLMKGEHKKTYDSRKKADFYKIFPQYAWHDDKFRIEYSNDHHTICIKSASGSSSIDLSTSESVAANFRQLKAAFQDFASGFSGDSRISNVRMLREFRSQAEINNLTQFEHSLFVPAARSFYAFIREEVFAILSMDEKIDKIIMQFGDFYETAKLRMSFENDRSSKNSDYGKYKGYFDKVAKGRYVRIDGRDWIEMERGRIEMSKASSGQQESFPLLISLAQFPAKGKTLIIEEPEAHLFPTAQVTVLDFMVRQSVTKETSIFSTTHSPYLLSSLNNHILRGANDLPRGVDPSRVRAYSLHDGMCENLMDEETGLISADYIDDASEEIYREFNEIIEGTHSKLKE